MQKRGSRRTNEKECDGAAAAEEVGEGSDVTGWAGALAARAEISAC